MSDNESDYYDDNSTSSSSSEEDNDSVSDEVKRSSKPIFNHAKKFANFEDDEDVDDADNSDSDPDDDEDESSSSEGEEDDDDDLQVGGVEDDPDNDDLDDEEEEEEEEDDTESEDEEEEEEDGSKPKKAKRASKPKTKTRVRKAVPQLVMDDEDEDDDEYDDNYLQKFEHSLTNAFDFHPETKMHNHDEVKQLAKVVRDEFGNIVDPLHRTLPYLSKYEKTRILGQRARQIEVGATPFVKVPENVIDGYVIAELELREKKLPFILRRPIPGGGFEYWHVRDLEDILF